MVADLSDEDLVALNFAEWRHGLECGVAAHHAGMVPRFKEVVENLFQSGLLKVVFATETLALGINMPARTVVIEKLDKWNGDTHAPLTPGEYTQLTGRAGRRGIDDEGNAVVVWQSNVDPAQLGGLASTRTYPLRSSFKPGYTMAVNILDSLGYERSVELLGQSFAQFQADRSVSGLNAQIQRQTEALAGYREAMQCHLGDFGEYAQLRADLANLEREAAKGFRDELRAETEAALEALREGDVVIVRIGRRQQTAVVFDSSTTFRGGPRISIITVHKEVRRLSAQDFESGPSVVGRLKLPKNFDARSARDRAIVCGQLSNLSVHAPTAQKKAKRPAAIEERITRLREQLRAHPCHGCNDREEHARWGERLLKLQVERAALQQQISHRTGVLSRDFARLCEILEALGYLAKIDDEYQVTELGQTLKHIHAESDLLVAEALGAGVFDGLTPELIVAVASTLIYEPRREEPNESRLPKGSGEAIAELGQIWARINQLEVERKLSVTSKPEAGFAFTAYRWASGHGLVRVLSDSDFTAGDFVRTTRRLIDLLEQMAAISQAETRSNVRAALDQVRRGIVAETDWAD